MRSRLSLQSRGGNEQKLTSRALLYERHGVTDSAFAAQTSQTQAHTQPTNPTGTRRRRYGRVRRRAGMRRWTRETLCIGRACPTSRGWVVVFEGPGGRTRLTSSTGRGGRLAGGRSGRGSRNRSSGSGGGFQPHWNPRRPIIARRGDSSLPRSGHKRGPGTGVVARACKHGVTLSAQFACGAAPGTTDAGRCPSGGGGGLGERASRPPRHGYK